MLQNNPNYTETQGTVKETQSNFNGMADTHVYSEAEKAQRTHSRAETDIQRDIYSLPTEKLLWQDIVNGILPTERRATTTTNENKNTESGE